jgi:hypothetical protein
MYQLQHRKKQGGQKFVKIDARFTTLILRD